MHQNDLMKVIVVKRENGKILESFFLVFLKTKERVSPHCHAHCLQNLCFYEHGFRSGFFLIISTHDVALDGS